MMGDEVVNRLNELNDENEQLQIKIADLRYENKTFKTNLSYCKRENKEIKHYNEAYADEIVNIKHTIKTMLKNERTEIGKNTLKQLWEAIQ